MDCVITAGGVPGPDDPLYSYTQGRPKALIDMEGRTMLERVVDALQTAHGVDRIVIVGLEGDMGMQFQRPIDQFLPDHGSLVGNAAAGFHWLRETNPKIETVLFCSSDVPAITGAIVDDFLERCQPFDKLVYYIFVTKQAMEERFPTSNRTYVKLKGAEIAGGDLAIGRAEMIDANEELFTALTDARKHAWKLARHVGLWTLFKFLTRQMGIGEAQTTAGRAVNGEVEVVVDPPAELAMDVDKPAQVELLRADLRRREAQGGS